MSKTLFLKNLLAEARGEIPQGTATQVTFAAIAQGGVEAVADAYYGKEAVQKAVDTAHAEQRAMDINDELIADIAPIVRTMQATQTTSDFPQALSQLRARRIRDSYKARDSRWRDFATVTTTPDFKPIRAMRFSGIPELKLRPEATDVQYGPKLDLAEDGYRVANYELAIKYTWEMHLNDDVGLFNRQLAALGEGALLTETMVVLEAIKAGLPRTALTVGAGAPTIQRMQEIENILASRSFDSGAGVMHEYGFGLTDVIHGTRQRQYLATILGTLFTDFQGGTPNAMAGAFTTHLEPMWARVMGNDVVAYDSAVEWLEVAFLQGFEGGPKTYTKIPDVREFPDEGSFPDHSMHVKVGHTVGSKVTGAEAAIRVEGA